MPEFCPSKMYFLFNTGSWNNSWRRNREIDEVNLEAWGHLTNSWELIVGHTHLSPHKARWTETKTELISIWKIRMNLVRIKTDVIYLLVKLWLLKCNQSFQLAKTLFMLLVRVFSETLSFGANCDIFIICLINEGSLFESFFQSSQTTIEDLIWE